MNFFDIYILVLKFGVISQKNRFNEKLKPKKKDFVKLYNNLNYFNDIL